MFNFFASKPKEPARLCFHTDVHCHIVPGVDDGSPDVETSVALVERMQTWGIDTIHATPHVTLGTFENNSANLDPALDALLEALRAKGNGIHIDHAAEYRIDDLFAQRLEAGDLMLYPAKHILIENSYLQEPWNLEQLAFDLQIKGLKPLLAHPERYLYYHKHRERYRQLHDTGLMFQINLLSLAGAYGEPEQKMARWLIKEEMVDFVGTDLHNSRHANAIDSYLHTRQAQKDLEALTHLVKNDTAFV